MSSARLSAMPLPVPFALIATVEPFTFTAPVVLPAVKVVPAPVASVVLPFDAKVVKAPVEAVEAPIAVPLIPVAVVLKLPDVIRRLLVPASIEEAESPASESVPDVAVKLRAPVVWVNPFDAVRRPFDVVVPVTLTLPPTEALLVTVALLSVASPDVLTVEREVLPVTPSVPPRVVAPVPTEKVLVPVTLVGPLSEIAPVPVEKVVAPDWVKFPLVVTAPVSSMAKFVVAPDLSARSVFIVPTFVSVITNAFPVPAFISDRPVAFPLLVRVNEVGVVNPEASVKAIFRPSVVVIVFPDAYACCMVTESGFAPQEAIWLEEFRQIPTAPVVLPRTGICVKLFKTMLLVPPALNVKSSPFGVVMSVDAPEMIRPVEPMVLLFKVWVWLAKTNVSSPASAGMVAVRGEVDARAEIVVVLVVPRTSWFVVACEVSVPAVTKLPSSLIVNLSMPFDRIAREVLVAALVSLMIKALAAVPALVMEKEVWVDKPEPKVKSMFLPVVVVMVLPES